MSSIVYIVHPLEQSIARSMCLKEGSELVVSLDTTLPPGKIERAVERSRFQQDENLSYGQVLQLLLKAEKVIAL